MANVNAIMSITSVDEDGRSASLPLYGLIADTETLASVGTSATGMASIVDAITDVKPTVISVTLQYAPTGVKTDPAANSDVQEGGLFSFNLGTPAGKSHGVWVPGISQDLVVADIIANTGDVLTFTAALTTGGGTVLWTNDLWNSAFASLKGDSGKQRFRKVGRR